MNDPSEIAGKITVLESQMPKPFQKYAQVLFIIDCIGFPSQDVFLCFQQEHPMSATSCAHCEGMRPSWSTWPRGSVSGGAGLAIASASISTVFPQP